MTAVGERLCSPRRVKGRRLQVIAPGGTRRDARRTHNNLSPSSLAFIESIGFRDDQWLDAAESPLTNSGKVTERFHRPDYGHLTIDVTIDDAKAYMRPWSTAIRLIAVPDTEMLDAQCLENEKDVPHLLNAKPEGAR